MNAFSFPHEQLPVPFVLVTGGKGGVGKTTLTARLGVELARRGLRILLVDLDLGLANLDLALGARADCSLEDALLRGRPFAECVIHGPDGVDLLPASSGNEEMGRRDSVLRDRLIDGLAELSEDYDLVLGDSAAGIGPDVLGFAAIAQRVLVVTTPDLAALTDAYGLIKALDQLGSRTGGDIPTPEVVVNQAGGVDQAKNVAAKLRQMCERFLSRSPRQAGWVPRSSRLARPLEDRVPELSAGLAETCLTQIATRLERLSAALGGLS